METARISFNEREMRILLAWIYEDFKPTNWHKVDLAIVKKIKRACKKLGCEDELDGLEENSTKKFDEDGFEITKEDEEDLKKRIVEIASADGIFFCPKCNVRTHKKTPTTTCIICNTPLLRGRGAV